MQLFSDNVKRKKLRPHQELAISMIRNSFRMNNKSVVCQMPTGAGKTFVASNMINMAKEKGHKVIFTAPAVTLIDQTVLAFEEEGIKDIGVMQAKHPRTNPEATVQICTLQTLGRRDIPEATLVIIDEVHIDNKAVDKIIDKNPDAFYVGLSATPWRKGMGLHWQDLVIPITIGELIELGYLSKFSAYAPHTPDLSKVKITAGDYNEKQLAEVMGNAKLVGDIVHTWLDKGENRPTLCFSVNCNHAAILCNQFKANGIAAAYCDAYTDSVEMRRIERQFRNGEVKVVCSVRKITTGVDWPVSCIIDAAPTKSEMLHVQKIGRGLRVNEGTEDLIILDHAGNSLSLGLVTDILYDELDKTSKGERQKKKKNEKLPKECSSCGTLFTGLKCPNCGYERKPHSGVEVVNGELIELTPKKKASKNEKQSFWSMALWIDDQRNKNGKLAKALYKGKFGCWPKGLMNAKIFPDKAFFNYEKARRIAYAKKMEKMNNASH